MLSKNLRRYSLGSSFLNRVSPFQLSGFCFEFFINEDFGQFPHGFTFSNKNFSLNYYPSGSMQWPASC